MCSIWEGEELGLLELLLLELLLLELHLLELQLLLEELLLEQLLLERIHLALSLALSLIETRWKGAHGHGELRGKGGVGEREERRVKSTRLRGS